MPRKPTTPRLPLAPAQRGPSGPTLLAIAILLAVGFLFFLPILPNAFTTWDDADTLAHNPAFNPPRIDGILRFWVKPHMSLYIPATYTLWGLLAFPAYSPEVRPTGAFLSPVPYHLANLALHLTSTILVFLLVRKILRRGQPQPAMESFDWPPFLAALLFALHPLQVETVAWISGLKDLLYSTLSLLALYLYLRSAAPKFAWRWYALATATLLLAMLAKPTAMVVPAMALLLDWALLQRSWRSRLLLLAPWFVLAIACGTLTKALQPAIEVAQTPLFLRPLVAADALAFYARQLALPLRMCIDYGRTPARITDSGAIWWSWLLPLACLVAAALLRQRRPIFLGLALFLLPLSPVLGFVRFEFQAYSTVADHYVYLAMFGMSFAIAALLVNRSPRFRWLAILLLVLLGIRSSVQMLHWRSSQTLFQHTLSVNPDSRAALNTLALQAMDAGKVQEALALAQRSIALYPDHPDAYIVIGTAFAQTGELQEAQKQYRQILARFPDNSGALASLAGVLAQLGNREEATSLITRALELSPEDPLAHMNHGIMLASAGDLAAARDELTEAVRLDPSSLGARINLAVILEATGARNQALLELQRVLRQAPADPRARRIYAEMMSR